MKKFKDYVAMKEAMSIHRSDMPSGVTPQNIETRPMPLDQIIDFRPLRNQRTLAAYQNALSRLTINPITSSEQDAANLALTHVRQAIEWLKQYAGYSATSHLRVG